ncbi:hypothetical protein PHYBLDRAFT_160109 [Phycomyces blakesleeanus NRRL 1555(-)]|uniref:Uncharacterized protein n=2 Tax=Phycomyces blakesleeanus TaxID=4837 RepID=A0A163D4S5_PHYB8|nr:hypothetical protein PHYBLDRAFT_160109 [Phycomyces blakesleeanus NRRL 1555(-)]OAD68730.1 hypothetical protein PHYBLDRAFT_160109 [Phycomyces blakesleeanus NRRL 1555(-)]|eukprot:XP_018286770.1 hypothetical protein PHYBLDRAFT_160109 [Phycomyces blakesleeanus NRRL 1555(-)]
MAGSESSTLARHTKPNATNSNLVSRLSMRRKTVVGYETKRHTTIDTTDHMASRADNFSRKSRHPKTSIPNTSTAVGVEPALEPPQNYNHHGNYSQQQSRRLQPDPVQRLSAIDRVSERRHSSYITSNSILEGRYSSPKPRRDYLMYVPKEDLSTIRPTPSESRLPRRSSFLNEASNYRR